jgi:hypothetical protein
MPLAGFEPAIPPVKRLHKYSYAFTAQPPDSARSKLIFLSDVTNKSTEKRSNLLSHYALLKAQNDVETDHELPWNDRHTGLGCFCYITKFVR